MISSDNALNDLAVKWYKRFRDKETLNDLRSNDDLLQDIRMSAIDYEGLPVNEALYVFYLSDPYLSTEGEADLLTEDDNLITLE